MKSREDELVAKSQLYQKRTHDEDEGEEEEAEEDDEKKNIEAEETEILSSPTPAPISGHKEFLRNEIELMN